MRRRILTAILSVTAIAIVLFAIPLGLVVRQLVGEDAALRVERQAVLAAREVPADFTAGDDPVELPATTDQVRLGLYGPDGALVTGSGPAFVEPAVRRALSNQVVDMELPGLRVVAVPVAADEQVIGIIRAEQPTDASDQRALHLVGLLVAIALAVMVVGSVIGALLSSRLARPVRALRDAAVDLGRGNYAVSLPRTSIPEIDEAATALTSAGRTLEDLIARERSFSADSSHQLRTPVAGMRAAIETELQFPRGDATTVLHEVLTDLDRLETTITELLSIARTPEVAGTALDLEPLLLEARTTWSPRLEAEGRTISLEATEPLPPAWANESMLKHVLDVLLDNARRHGRGAVRIVVTAAGPHVTVSVHDEGPPFSPSARDASGTTSTTTDPSHGHGLPLATRYVEAMRGRLVVHTTGPTTRIDIVLRRAAISSYPPLA
ncbi:HAMP domain-containing sensor histidine kinase [Nocardioides psychrotolerans]|uniref:sensor histidine kinase n=1 Tax=Nocardioides psychrotolerans TaxID=1005945 RepID=UPI00313794F4